jgi:hypothetical protein
MRQDEFVGGVVGVAGWGENLPIDKDLIKVVNVDANEGSGLFDEEVFLLKQGDCEFDAQIGFADGEVVGKVEGDLHGLGSLVRGFAEFVDVGDDDGSDQAIFAPFFGDFDEATIAPFGS